MISYKEEPVQIVRNAFPIKVSAPEKRIKLTKDPEPLIDTKQEKQESSLLVSLQTAVEQKLEKQQKENKDVMERVIVLISIPLKNRTRRLLFQRNKRDKMIISIQPYPICMKSTWIHS